MKLSIIATALTAALLVSFVPAEAFAKGQPTPHEIYMRKCNQQAHAQARLLRADFATIDTNRDQQLQAAEISDTRMSSRCKARCLNHLDRNHDGALSEKEVGHPA